MSNVEKTLAMIPIIILSIALVVVSDLANDKIDALTKRVEVLEKK